MTRTLNIAIAAILMFGMNVGLIQPPAYAQGTKRAKPQSVPTPNPRVTAALEFSTDEVTLLYDVCRQSGGSVTIKGGEFTCTKSAASTATSVSRERTVASTPQSPGPALPGARASTKYTGASSEAAARTPVTTGDFAKVHSIEKLIPMIQVGVTTRDEIVAALKEPVSSSFDSTGTETAIFRESVAFWKTGGVGQLFTKRGPVKKTLTVFFKNGRVSYFQVGDQR